MLDYHKFSFDVKIYSDCLHRSGTFNFHADHYMNLKYCLWWLGSNKFLLHCQQGSNHSDETQGKLS